MTPQRLFQHFEKIPKAPEAILRLRRFYLEYRDYAVQIPQTPSGKSQVSSSISTSEHPFNISQTPSAQLIAAFPLKKRLMEWGEAALQSELGQEDDEP